MKIFRNIITIAAMMIMSSCAEEIIEMSQNEGSLLKLNVETPDTRSVVDGVNFSKGDAVGVFVSNLSGNDYSATQNCNNIKAVYDGGSWNLMQNFELNSTEGKVIAYYPYNPNLKFDYGYVDIDVTPGTEFGQQDFMYGTSSNNVSENNSTANIKFNHSLARITLAITKGANDVGEGRISKVVLQNDSVYVILTAQPSGQNVYKFQGRSRDLVVNGCMDLRTGVIKQSFDEEARIVLTDTYTIKEKDATLIDILVIPNKDYYGMQVPGVLDLGIRATLTIDGNDYSFLLGDIVTEAGMQYTFPITIDRQTDPSNVETVFDNPANSYIVSESGKYRFLTTKGNSYESVGDVASVEVLWESFGTDVAPNVGDLISSVSYSGDWIKFSTSTDFKEGNAVLAAKDSQGNILWSWHIWMTDKPEDHVYKNNAGTAMDRNLGATSATPGDVGTLGLLYQWGRKDPFLGSSSISDAVLSVSTLEWPEPVYLSSSISKIEYSLTNPTTFIKSYDNDDNNLRWQNSKTIYDPCPSGYRVPDGGVSGLWCTAFDFDTQTADGFYRKSDWDNVNKGIDFSQSCYSLMEGEICWYPYTFKRSSNGEFYTFNGGESSDRCGYWSCSTNGMPYYLEFSADAIVYPADRTNELMGFSVRCVKE